MDPAIDVGVKPGEPCDNCAGGAVLVTPIADGLALVCNRCGKFFRRYKESSPEPAKIDQGQQGGDHYKRLWVTPWDIIKSMESCGLCFVDYARGDIIAYVARLKGTPGNRPEMLAKLEEDMRKAAHYATAAADVLKAEVDRLKGSFDKNEAAR